MSNILDQLEDRTYRARRLVDGILLDGHTLLFAEPRNVFVYLGYFPEEETGWFLDEKRAYKFVDEQRVREAAGRATKRVADRFGATWIYHRYGGIEYFMEHTKTVVTETQL